MGMGCTNSGCRRGGSVYDPSEQLLALPPQQRRGSKPTLLRSGRINPKPQKEENEKKDDWEDEERIDSIVPSNSSTSSNANRRLANIATPKRPSRPSAQKGNGLHKALTPPRTSSKPISPVAFALSGSSLPLPPSAILPPPPSSSEGSGHPEGTESERSVPTGPEVPRKRPSMLCCGNICGAIQLLRTRKEGVETAESSTAQPQLPIARAIQEDRRTERHHRAAELRKRFQLARETVKGLSLSAEEKLQLYAYEKQATEGPVSGVRPGAFNMLARARWDSWAKLKRMDKEVAKQGYCALVDKFAPGWRAKAGL
mmetsp:Transcript_106845/g.130298  ORF Transcript_106845/g.130298 Transcript_106845/m.130298 type:complete len:313 (+) Transcript_106845:52-990(+)